MTARVALVSLRRLNAHAAWCSNYEFEDVIRSVDDVDLIEPERDAFSSPRERIAKSFAFRGVASRLNPGLKRTSLGRDYDLLVFVCMNVWDLLVLNAVTDWRSRARRKVCYMVEFYAGQERTLGSLLRLLDPFDHVTQSFGTSVEAVARATGRPCSHVALACDALRFSPFPSPPPRSVDVLSIGGRAEGVHQALRRAARERGWFYVHDTISGARIVPASPVEHREMYARMASRSRLFVAYPAKFGYDENQGLLEVGARYYEGLAAGAVLVGQAPTAPAFHADFPWPRPVHEARPDGSDAVAVVEDLLSRPDELARVGVRNAAHALRHHDWAHRWRALLTVAGLPALPALEGRLARLEALARLGESMEVAA